MTRLRAAPPPEIVSVTYEELSALTASGAGSFTFWIDAKGADAELVRRFKNEVKEHYFRAQGLKCCFCSIDLADHKGTFAAEHIIARKTRPEFMFDPRNIAVACFPCNTHKKADNVLSEPRACAEVPVKSDRYLIVHPHHDEWTDHFYFDPIQRIKVLPNSEKGSATFTLCGFDHLNDNRLAAALGAASSDEVAIRNRFFDEDRSDVWRQKFLALIREIAASGKHDYLNKLVEEFSSYLDEN